VDPRDRWQALKAQLVRAQERFRAGDRAGTLDAVDAALAIDPNFLAAHSLRERVIAEIGLTSTPGKPSPPPVAAAPAAPEPVRPMVSVEGYARFEQRIRRRRVDRRIDAANAAIAEGRSNDLAAAIAEIRELDPNLSELQDLAVALNNLPEHKRHSASWLAAAAVFGAIVLGATWLEESGALGSRPMVAVPPVVAPPQSRTVALPAAEASDNGPDAITAETAVDAPAAEPAAVHQTRSVARVGTVGTVPAAIVTPLSEPPALPATNPNQPDVATAPAPPPPPPTPAVVPSSITIPENASATPAAVALSTAVGPTIPPPSAPVMRVDEEALVRQTLQRYRNAYEGLDAHSARAVWPTVNESALARAFDGLESQALTFDTCNVSVRGDAAAVVCRGTTRYVPKVGSREPRTEPRTWNFTLRKAGPAWTIESARAAR